MGWNKDLTHFQKVNELIEESQPSKAVDIGEKYTLVTGIDEDKAGGLDARLMPNLHKRWIPSKLVAGPYNGQLYKDSAEQEFYENFIQPLFIAYKTGQYKKHFDAEDNILRHNWDKHVNIDALGPEKVLFERRDGNQKSVSVGEIETTLILVTHFLDDLYKYSYYKIARRFGSSVRWVSEFRKRLQRAYGKMAAVGIEEHLERQLGRCEGILDTFMEKARDGDPYAAKIVKDFMDKEDQYIMPTLEQVPVKDTEETRNAAMDRLEKIFERKKVEGKTVTDVKRIETTPEMVREAFEHQKEKGKNETKDTRSK